MKNVMKKTLLASLALMLIFPLKTMAQEWTKDQKEVWQVVQNSWEAWKNKDVSSYFSNLHDQYMGWNSEQPLPTNKSELRSSVEARKDMMTLNHYVINPARIVVTKEAAVVDYYYVMYYTWKQGDKEKMDSERGKFVEFYVKDGGNWKLLGDMTYIEPQKHHDGDDD
ncbi:MAG TPA: DUF4440 domain-containing protein [Bacteroidales bacterium]|nr:DUF4440 domain-containing protein [Bacteroidales bacterium]